MQEIILINITGKDRPGLTSSLTHILAQYEVTILDIGQADRHLQRCDSILQQLAGLRVFFVENRLAHLFARLGVER